LAVRFADDEAGADDDGVASEVCDRVVLGEPDWCEPPLAEASSCVASFSGPEEDPWLLELDEDSWLLDEDSWLLE
jgi:hypothetical protein